MQRSVLTCLVVLSCLLTMLDGNSSAEPSIVVTEESHDLGEVTQGKEAEYVFTFENRGSEELVIQKVGTS